MSSTIGNKLKLSIFGQSHSEAIGGVIDGFPPGMRVDFDALSQFLNRRRPGGSTLSTSRNEGDVPEFLSGLVNGVTCDAPISFIIKNTDVRPLDYSEIADCPRPSHSDFPAHVHSGGFNDVRGGGHFSGRLTAPLCVAGALCLQYLREKGIDIGAHVASIADIADDRFDPMGEDVKLFKALAGKDIPVINDAQGQAMKQAVSYAKTDGDSLGGVVECMVTGLAAGLGSPMFDTVEGRLALALFGIPAVKGVEFGSGFSGSSLRGSENNDGYTMQNGQIKTVSNNAGGVLGGLTTGMPVVFRAAIKPTPSTAKPQRSVSFSGRCDKQLTISGRHDPCIVIRAVPVIEAAAAITVLDIML